MANNYSTDLEASSTQYWQNASSTTLALTGDFTIEFWVKFESLPSSGNNMWMIEKKSEAGLDYAIYAVYISNSAGTYRFNLRTTNGSASSNQDDSVTFSPSTGTWMHLAVTRTSSGGVLKFYVNGSQQGTDQTGYSGALAGDTNRAFNVGFYRAAEPRCFDGLINDLRLWSAVRTGTEINDNKDNCSLSNSATNLVSRWFNENNNGNDQTASGNTLTAINSPTFSTDVAYSCAVGPTTLSSMNSVTKANISSVDSTAIASITSINSVA